MDVSQASAGLDQVNSQRPRIADETPRGSSPAIRGKPKNDTQALQQRVRQLEAQIANMTAGLPNTQTQKQWAAVSSPGLWTPDLRLITDFGSPDPSFPTDETSGQFASDTGLSPIGIPRIQVVDYAESSPTSLSPSALLHPIMATPPSIAPNSFDSGLRPRSAGAGISPPTTVCSSPNHEFIPYLSPPSVPETFRSRSSSVSSLSLDWVPASQNISLPGLTDPELGMTMTGPATDPEFEVLSPPTRFEAEMLLDRFFAKTGGSGYPVERDKLFGFLDIIYNQWEYVGGHEPLYPPSIARYHVYMAMAIALRMEKDGRKTTTQLLRNCYRLAIKEVRSPSFWEQPLAIEGAMLLVWFAQSCKDEQGSHTRT
ncbi:hypothetical protein AOCH_001624 [Aspergillus ochraceoroseus]|uniref:Transcription factor domain-containing protein n=1 Tax=Aspergillus ochraceoroseus TaxID=138278 RepID=A0A0F8UYE4_9EURO|nr:hypothetical protein AOCH_001624 [Aspergillus ochraceoroseus]